MSTPARPGFSSPNQIKWKLSVNIYHSGYEGIFLLFLQKIQLKKSELFGQSLICVKCVRCHGPFQAKHTGERDK